MAMKTGIGLSRILVLAGAGYTGTILVKNGKMSDILGGLQSLVKRFEKSEDRSDDDSDGMTTEMQRLAMEVRQLASSRQITVINGAQGADYTHLIVPTMTLGALGYGYMWFKGITFSDIMCITKANMENAVANLSKHLDTVSEAISNVKKHLSQRLQKVDDKLDLQKDLLKEVKDNVGLALDDLANMGGSFDAMHSMFGGMGGKLDSIEYKQNIANLGLMYLCDSMGGENHKMPDILIQEKLRLSGKSNTCILITNEETSTSEEKLRVSGKSNTCIVITNEETSTSEGLRESDKIELLDEGRSFSMQDTDNRG